MKNILSNDLPTFVSLDKIKNPKHIEKDDLKVLIDKYEKRVIRKQGCWDWDGFKNPKGYGVFSFMGKALGIHRASWMINHGLYIPESMFICHKCDNPPCSNPDHLFLGLPMQNIHDILQKGKWNTEKRKEGYEKRLITMKLNREKEEAYYLNAQPEE